ncbi:DNA ligase [Shewanella sp. D64]|uniref:DNA ligase n=1 Tax=unclassified Shewanella TaxID=196818 RepID=UPI0022BA2F2A|nr:MULTISPECIES: DNA ligase [unclassified Shewanella]MEC4724861.1 DNA ligase [Shewanella sp. D64]MEC4736345.1 DNA ligase [Shewanella sp. E94]WBJ97594.1 DNA ligase [Shewanella sp. MTB7]
MKKHFYQLFVILLFPLMIFPTLAGIQLDEIAKYQDPLHSAAKPVKHRIQLATNAKIEGDINDYLVSEKLDGVRGYWDGEQLFTRGDNAISAPKWFTQGFPDYPLEGELWMGRGTFEQMSGLVRRKIAVDNDWRTVKFMVFDLPESSLSFGLRYQHFVKTLANKSAYLSVIEQKHVTTLDELDTWLARVVNQGGEGLMLHHQTSLYIAGRNKDLIKLKPFFDAEATVISHIQGKGQFEGILGSILVETPAGIRFKIGTGFTLEERRNPPEVGVMVTYKYSGLTQKGTPRFASFLRVRLKE